MTHQLKSYFNYIFTFFLVLVLISFNVMKVFELGDGIPFNLALSDFLIPIIGLLILIKLIMNKSLAAIKYFPLMILLMVWLILTSWLGYKNENLIASGWMTVFGEWVKTGICIAYFYTGYQILDHMSKEWILRFYAISYIIFVGYGFATLYALNRGIDILLLEENASSFFLGTYHDPNHAATYLTLSFFILLYGVNLERDLVGKVFYLFLGLTSFAAIVLTDSRGGLLGFAVAFMVYILVAYYNRIRYIVSLMWTMMIALFGAMVFDAKVNDGKFIRSLFNSFMQFDKGLDIRANLMKAAFAMGKDYPFFGIGRGNYILNAESYAENLGLDITYHIPHNTYIGLFAEVGIIGLGLYMLPMILIIILLIKKRKVILSNWLTYQNLIASLLAIVIGLGIQAYVLNVENRRILWFLAGALLSWITNMKEAKTLDKEGLRPDIDKSFREDKVSKQPWLWVYSWHFWLNIILGVMTLWVFFYTTGEVFWPKSYETLYGNYTMELPVPEEYNNIPMELEFYLYAHQSGLEEQDTLKVRIFEEHVKGYRSVRYSYIFPRTRGTIKVPFVKEWEDSTIFIEVMKEANALDSYRLLPKRILTEEKVLVLNREYYMLAFDDEVEHLYNKWEDLNEDLYVSKNFKSLLEDFEETVFEGVFVVENVEHIYDGVNNQLVVSYKVLHDIKEDYNIWLYANPADLSNIDVSRYLSNLEYYSPIEPIFTSGWMAGKSYDVVYDLPRDYGWYRLVGGIQHKVNEKWIRLKDDETDKNYVIFGWFESGTNMEE